MTCEYDLIRIIVEANSLQSDDNKGNSGLLKELKKTRHAIEHRS